MKSPDFIHWSKSAYSYAVAMAVIGWFAVIAQLYLIIINRVAPVTETIVRFFSFYTILTNILIALSATSLLVGRNSWLHRFFASTKIQAALTVYIIVVGVVYNVILRFLWSPSGLQFVVDEVLHTVIPVLYLLFWLRHVPKAGLKWNHIPAWLVYPFAYAVYILVRGSVSGFYPYPFLEVTKIGYPQTFINILFLIIFFFIVSGLIVLLDRYAKKKMTGVITPPPAI